MTPTDPTQGEALQDLVALWLRACRDFVALAREIPAEQWDLPTDLAGWSVKDNVAHVAHLESVLAGAPDEIAPVEDAPHLRGPMNHYTEQGVLARRGQPMDDLVAEIEQAVAARHAELEAAPPAEPTAPPARTFGGAPWDTVTLLRNRPFDIWVHEQDIRRAIDSPGGFNTPVATHALAVLGRGLPMVVGKRLAPPAGTTIRVQIPDAGHRWIVGVGEDGRAGFLDPEVHPDVAATTIVSLSPRDFLLLAAGRRGPEATDPEVSGDTEDDVTLGYRLLACLAITP